MPIMIIIFIFITTSVQSWIRVQLQHPILYAVLIETASPLAKGQYTIYSSGTSK